MERGPLLAFGTIVAIGIGPALWLGAQLGTVTIAPDQRPNTVGEQLQDNDRDFGGVGAGETADSIDAVTDHTARPSSATPRARATTPPPARPSASPTVSVSITRSPSVSPPVSVSASVPPSSSPPPAPPEPSASSGPVSTGPTSAEPAFSAEPAPDVQES